MQLVGNVDRCDRVDRRQDRLYGPDAYRIAGDTVPWSNPPWNGDQAAWQRDIDYFAPAATKPTKNAAIITRKAEPSGDWSSTAIYARYCSMAR